MLVLYSASHLVQSTKAGAEFGFGLIWALVIAIILKYPFFRYAPSTRLQVKLYCMGIKNCTLYFQLFSFYYNMYNVYYTNSCNNCYSWNSQLKNLFSVEIWTLIIMILSFCLLIFGRYTLLDKLMKFLILLAISTILSFLIAAENYSDPIDLKRYFLQTHHQYF